MLKIHRLVVPENKATSVAKSCSMSSQTSEYREEMAVRLK